MKRPIAVITGNPRLVEALVENRALQERLGVHVALTVWVRPSMAFFDRIRDLRATIARRAKINRVSFFEQTAHYFAYRPLAQATRPAEPPASMLARLGEGQRVLEATSVNDPAVVAALRSRDFALGVVLGCNVFSRRTLEALALPLYNVHLGDPAFVRGLPPAFWEVLAGRDEILPTLHRLTATLDGGDVIHQHAVPVAWQATLRGTLLATHARLMAAVPAIVEAGLRQIVDGTARARTIVPGPLRTTPTIGQLVAAARICRARAAALRGR